MFGLLVWGGDGKCGSIRLCGGLWLFRLVEGVSKAKVMMV